MISMKHALLKLALLLAFPGIATADPDGLHRWSNDKQPNPFTLALWIPPNLPVVHGLVVIGDGGEVAPRCRNCGLSRPTSGSPSPGLPT